MSCEKISACFMMKIVTLIFLFVSCACEKTEEPCVVHDTIAYCNNNTDFQSLQDLTITKLVVRSQELKELNKNNLTAYENLEVIDLSNSGLEQIDSEAFKDLEKLQELNLSGNDHLKISNEAAFASESLTNLSIANIPIDDLNEKFFADIPSLIELDLSSTGIKNFSFTKYLGQLTTLTISKVDYLNTLQLCQEISTVKEINVKSENGTEQIDCVKQKDNKVTNDNATITEKQTQEDNVVVETTTKQTKEDNLVVETTTENQTKGDNIVDETTLETQKVELTTDKAVSAEETTTTENTTTEASNHSLETETRQKSTEKLNNEIEKPLEVQTEKIETKKEMEQNPKVEEAPDVHHGNHDHHDHHDHGKTHDNYIVKISDNDESEVKDILPSTSDTSTSQKSAVNIILGIILCVMVVGAVGFGYKYWKNRRSGGYTHANTNENQEEGKELQTIVAHHTDSDHN